VSKKQNKFQILKSLERGSHPTQRQLSNDLGVSLGKINYCLKILVKKGFIKVNNFINNKNKIQYSYLLTPKGVEEKAKLTLGFIRIKTQEYDTLKQEIESLTNSLELSYTYWEVTNSMRLQQGITDQMVNKVKNLFNRRPRKKTRLCNSSCRYVIMIPA
jgi:EPS-associated MarR family transcriptional regulator